MTKGNHSGVRGRSEASVRGRRDWLRNPIVWGFVVIVVGVVVGLLTISAAVRYDGPSDITCSRQFGGNSSWVSCEDSAYNAAATGALLGDTSEVTVRSDALLWTARIAFLPAAVLLIVTVLSLGRMAITGGAHLIRGRLRRRHQDRRDRERWEARATRKRTTRD